MKNNITIPSYSERIEQLLEELNTMVSHDAFTFVKKIKELKDFNNLILNIGMFFLLNL